MRSMMRYLVLILVIIPAYTTGQLSVDFKTPAQEFCEGENRKFNVFGPTNKGCAFYCMSANESLTAMSGDDKECEMSKGRCHHGECVIGDSDIRNDKNILNITYELKRSALGHVAMEVVTNYNKALICAKMKIEKGKKYRCTTIGVSATDLLDFYFYKDKNSKTPIDLKQVDLEKPNAFSPKSFTVDGVGVVRVLIEKVEE